MSDLPESPLERAKRNHRPLVSVDEMVGLERERTFNARCGVCDHVWTLAHLPMPVHEWARLAKAARCPKGCKGKVLCA